MKNMYKHILTVVDTLEQCGFDKLTTFCHGDAKPNNFLFRNIEIDIEELECEGIQSILIDWQGGFLGCAANDLMWALFPFLEKHAEDKVRPDPLSLDRHKITPIMTLQPKCHTIIVWDDANFNFVCT